MERRNCPSDNLRCTKATQSTKNAATRSSNASKIPRYVGWKTAKGRSIPPKYLPEPTQKKTTYNEHEVRNEELSEQKIQWRDIRYTIECAETFRRFLEYAPAMERCRCTDDRHTDRETRTRTIVSEEEFKHTDVSAGLSEENTNNYETSLEFGTRRQSCKLTDKVYYKKEKEGSIVTASIKHEAASSCEEFDQVVAADKKNIKKPDLRTINPQELEVLFEIPNEMISPRISTYNKSLANQERRMYEGSRRVTFLPLNYTQNDRAIKFDDPDYFIREIKSATLEACPALLYPRFVLCVGMDSHEDEPEHCFVIATENIARNASFPSECLPVTKVANSSEQPDNVPFEVVMGKSMEDVPKILAEAGQLHCKFCMVPMENQYSFHVKSEVLSSLKELQHKSIESDFEKHTSNASLSNDTENQLGGWQVGEKCVSHTNSSSLNNLLVGQVTVLDGETCDIVKDLSYIEIKNTVNLKVTNPDVFLTRQGEPTGPEVLKEELDEGNVNSSVSDATSASDEQVEVETQPSTSYSFGTTRSAECPVVSDLQGSVVSFISCESFTSDYLDRMFTSHLTCSKVKIRKAIKSKDKASCTESSNYLQTSHVRQLSCSETTSPCENLIKSQTSLATVDASNCGDLSKGRTGVIESTTAEAPISNTPTSTLEPTCDDADDLIARVMEEAAKKQSHDDDLSTNVAMIHAPRLYRGILEISLNNVNALATFGENLASVLAAFECRAQVQAYEPVTSENKAKGAKIKTASDHNQMRYIGHCCSMKCSSGSEKRVGVISDKQSVKLPVSMIAPMTPKKNNITTGVKCQPFVNQLSCTRHSVKNDMSPRYHRNDFDEHKHGTFCNQCFLSMLATQEGQFVTEICTEVIPKELSNERFADHSKPLQKLPIVKDSEGDKSTQPLCYCGIQENLNQTYLDNCWLDFTPFGSISTIMTPKSEVPTIKQYLSGIMNSRGIKTPTVELGTENVDQLKCSINFDQNIGFPISVARISRNCVKHKCLSRVSSFVEENQINLCEDERLKITVKLREDHHPKCEKMVKGTCILKYRVRPARNYRSYERAPELAFVQLDETIIIHETVDFSIPKMVTLEKSEICGDSNQFEISDSWTRTAIETKCSLTYSCTTYESCKKSPKSHVFVQITNAYETLTDTSTYTRSTTDATLEVESSRKKATRKNSAKPTTENQTNTTVSGNRATKNEKDSIENHASDNSTRQSTHVKAPQIKVQRTSAYLQLKTKVKRSVTSGVTLGDVTLGVPL